MAYNYNTPDFEGLTPAQKLAKRKQLEAVTPITPVKPTVTTTPTTNQTETSIQRSKRLQAEAKPLTTGDRRGSQTTFSSIISGELSKIRDRAEQTARGNADYSNADEFNQFGFQGKLYKVNETTGKLEEIGKSSATGNKVVGVRASGQQFNLGDVSDSRAAIQTSGFSAKDLLSQKGGLRDSAIASQKRTIDLRAATEQEKKDFFGEATFRGGKPVFAGGKSEGDKYTPIYTNGVITGYTFEGDVGGTTNVSGAEKLQKYRDAGLMGFETVGGDRREVGGGINTLSSQLGLATQTVGELGEVDFASQMLDLDPNRPKKGENESAEQYQVKVLNWSLDNISQAFNATNSQMQTDKLAEALKQDFSAARSLPTLRQRITELKDNKEYNEAMRYLDDARQSTIDNTVDERMRSIQATSETTRNAIRDSITAEVTKKIDTKILRSKAKINEINNINAKKAAKAERDAFQNQSLKTPEELAKEEKESMIQSETNKIQGQNPIMGIYEARERAKNNIEALTKATGTDVKTTAELNNLFSDPVYRAQHQNDAVEIAFDKFNDIDKAKDYAKKALLMPQAEINRQVADLQEANGWDEESRMSSEYKDKKDSIIAGGGDKSGTSLSQLYKDYATFDPSGLLQEKLSYAVLASDETNASEKSIAREMLRISAQKAINAQPDIEEKILRNTATAEERANFFSGTAEIERAKTLSTFIDGGEDISTQSISSGNLIQQQGLSPAEQQKLSLLGRIRTNRLERVDLSKVEQLSINQGWNDEYREAVAEGKPIAAATAKQFGVAEGITKGQFNDITTANTEAGLGNKLFQGSDVEEYGSLQNYLDVNIDLRTLQYLKMGYKDFAKELEDEGLSEDQISNIMEEVEGEVDGALNDEDVKFEDHTSINTGGGVKHAMWWADFSGITDSFRQQLHILSGKYTVEYMKAASGVAISEQEARRLKQLIPNVDMADQKFIAGLRDSLKESDRTAIKAAGFYNVDGVLGLQAAIDGIGNKITTIEDKRLPAQETFAPSASIPNYTAPSQGFRTDRHNNPLAVTTQVAEQAGLKEGVDFEVGDAFPNNPNQHTARLLGDPEDVSMKLIDNIGFFTKSGAPRWTHTTNISNELWGRLSRGQKLQVIAKMHQQEGGSGIFNFTE